ncbi:SDR family NAD(P)-dependent oxidoreductase [Streptomyces sp. NPDC087903]|uniref:SDR family NAD(P)-dependent oxidoreductase n=1 Tax=Streptomyces sp. NPDC087903 TaxID=3365819 RepID=UPI003813B21A
MGILDDKVAIVTGGGRGLGRAHCLALAEAGATVVVNDLGSGVHGERTGDSPADDVVAEITKLGGRATANHASVTDWDATEAMVADTVAEFGRLDVIVNNAGIVRDRMLFSMTEAEFDAVIAVHLKGTFALTRHACAYWRAASKRGERVAGRVINTTSGTGLFGNQGQSNYGAAKAGVAGLTVITALEMRRYGVTANAISPIATTRMTADLAVGQPAPAEGGFDPGDPANASGVVVYLASDEAAWLTGQVLRIEGHKLNRLRGWTVAGVHPSRSGGALTTEELIDAVPELYGVAPAGRAIGAGQ